MWSISPCSLVEVPLSGQFANTSSATHVRLFLPCNRKVQSRRERSRAFWVSSFTPLQGGILVMKDSIWSVLHITERRKHNLHNDRQGITVELQFKLYYEVPSARGGSNSQQLTAFNPLSSLSTWIRTLILMVMFAFVVNLVIRKDHNFSENQIYWLSMKST